MVAQPCRQEAATKVGHLANPVSKRQVTSVRRLVSGHDFSRAIQALQKNRALAPVMAIPRRNSKAQAAMQSQRTFFVTTRTCSRRRIFQVHRNVELFIDVLRSHARRFQIHDFVVMPDHVHLLVTVDGTLSIERAVQLIKGGYSYRVRSELGYSGEVWQRGFSEVRVNGEESFRKYREYIAQNPVRAGLVESAALFPWCFEALRKRKAQGLKPGGFGAGGGTTEVVP